MARLLSALFASALLVAACSRAPVSPHDGPSGTVRLSGAWALYPLAVAWAEEFQRLYPSVRIDISAGGAGKGMADALGGLVDLGMVSRAVAPEETARGSEYFRDRVIALKEGSISTSGSYRNFHKSGSNVYMHIGEPRSGRPLQSETVSVTTWAPDCTSADAWSTALFTLPASNALALAQTVPGLECLIVLRPAPGTNAFRFLASAGFAARTRD